MCLRPITLRNPSSSISRYGGHPLLMDVRCNDCAECRKAIRLEYRFRSFHEVSSCVNNGGFVYFDTLTYDNEHLPKLSRYIDVDDEHDFSCFDSRDWRNFLKNLRRHLDYHYKGITFKYFLTSEYGLDENYTHRPHYHILFFVNSKTIDPFIFSLLVSKCWPCGRTDGLPFKKRSYVREHIFGVDVGQEKPYDFLKACNYVSKYITKDSSFQDTINKRIDFIKNKFNTTKFSEVESLCSRNFISYDKVSLKELLRNISMFHRQSQGFGKSFLDNLNTQEYERILKSGIVSIPDGDKVVATLPLPMYYKRKLFYDIKRDDEGKYYWQLNSRGQEYIYNLHSRNITNLSTNYLRIFLNSSDDEKSIISRYLNGRSFCDLAIYVTLFRNRHFVGPLFSPHDWYEKVMSSYYVHELQCSDIYHIDRERNVIYIPDNSPTLLHEFCNIKEYNYDSFISQHVINEDSLPDFINFDKLINFIKSIQLTDNVQKQLTFDFIEEIEQKFKHLFKYGY